jgi:hypothetical protein
MGEDEEPAETEAACEAESDPVDDLIGDELPEDHNPWAEDGEESDGKPSA